MLVDVIMPKMGESIMDGRILKWFKKPGDTIGKDESLFEISTDKVDTEVPVAEAGVIVEVLYNEGDNVNVGEVVARIETDAANAKVKTNGEAKKKETPKEPEPVAVESATLFEQASVETAPVAEKTGEAGFYSPLVMKIASSEGVSMNELALITGTGIGGRV